MLSLRARAVTPRNFGRRYLATPTALPQTYVEKIVQRHAVGLPEGAVVKSGDYVMIKPQHVMTHVSRIRHIQTPLTDTRLSLQDNTGPVISKCVDPCSQLEKAGTNETLDSPDSSRLAQARFPILAKLSLLSIMTYRTDRKPTWPSTPRLKRLLVNTTSTFTPLDVELVTRS